MRFARFIYLAVIFVAPFMVSDVLSQPFIEQQVSPLVKTGITPTGFQHWRAQKTAWFWRSVKEGVMGGAIRATSIWS